MANNTFNPHLDSVNPTKRPETHVDFTRVNMSHDFISTCSMGQIVPFLMRPVLPGDFVDTSGSEYLFRFAPMYLPILSQVKVYVDYFYVPTRLLWGLPKNTTVYQGENIPELEGWETFISSFDDSKSQPYIEIPMSDYALTGMDEIISHLGIPTDQDAAADGQFLRVVPWPFLAYLFIYDEHYRNSQVQDRRFFRWLDTWPQDYATLVSSFAQIGQVPNNRLSLLRRNWDNDYFTIMTPTPQLGANVVIPMINDTGFWDATLLADTISYPSRWKGLITDLPTGANENVGTQGLTGGGISSGGTSGIPIGLDIQETAATIRQLRASLQTTEILERAMRAGDKYDDFVIKFHDEDPNPLEIDCPQWFGGHVGRVVISDVYTTANTETATPGLPSITGSYGGTAVSVDKIKGAKVKVRDYGYIFGLLSVIPETGYQNGLPHHWTAWKWYDFPFEQLMQIGDRELKRMEMELMYNQVTPPGTIINDFILNQEVLGYVPRGHEWRYANNVVAGQMRTIWTSFHLGRILSQDIGDAAWLDLNDELLVCMPRVQDVFQVTRDASFTEHECYILVHNRLFIDRRIPKYSVPTT